ncbi:MAG: hypothetical protein ACE14V_01310 [bacterium]
MLYTTRNNLKKPSLSDPSAISDLNDNADIIDSAIAECNWTAVSDPTTGDDSGDGYSIGSRWQNTSSGDRFECSDATAGAAVWVKYYPQAGVTDHGDLTGLEDDDHTQYVLAAGTRTITGAQAFDLQQVVKQINTPAAPAAGYTAVYAKADGKIYKRPSGGAESEIAAGVTDHGALTGLTDDDHTQYVKDAEFTAKGDVLLGTGNGTFAKLSASDNGKVLTLDSTQATGCKWDTPSVETSVNLWRDAPGTPTRVSDTQFTVADAGGANNYVYLYTKSLILKWDEGGTFNTAMVISSSYADDTVTVDIVGDSLTAGFASMKYCSQRAQYLEWFIFGTQAVGTNLARTHYAPCDMIKISIDTWVSAAGTTNSQTIDINDDGTSIITTKPSIASGATSDLDNVCDSPSTVIAIDSLLTLDVDAVHSTPADELYARLWYYPNFWRYIP